MRQPRCCAVVAVFGGAGRAGSRWRLNRLTWFSTKYRRISLNGFHAGVQGSAQAFGIVECPPTPPLASSTAGSHSDDCPYLGRGVHPYLNNPSAAVRCKKRPWLHLFAVPGGREVCGLGRKIEDFSSLTGVTFSLALEA